MTDPRIAISIVLPTYNGSKYLAGAIESVIRQTRTDWELIIVDNGSTDETPQIIARYVAQDVRISSTFLPQSAGKLPSALNAGFALARGHYHRWLADDDELMPEALETFAGYLDAHPEIGLVYSHYLASYDDGPPQVQHRPLPDLLPSKNVILPSFLYRAEVHRTIGGYRPEVFLAEDYDFFLRAYEHVRFHRLDAVLHFYRFHAGGLTAASKREAIDTAVKRTLIDNLEHLRWLQKPYPRSLAYLYLYELARRHRWPEARGYWWTAFRAAPHVVLRRMLLAALPSSLQQRVAGWYQRVFRKNKV